MPESNDPMPLVRGSGIESSPVADARAIVHGCDSMLKLLSGLGLISALSEASEGMFVSISSFSLKM